MTMIPITKDKDIKKMANGFGGCVQFSSEGHLKVPEGTFNLKAATLVMRLGEGGPFSSTMYCVKANTFDEAIDRVIAIMVNPSLG